MVNFRFLKNVVRLPDRGAHTRIMRRWSAGFAAFILAFFAANFVLAADSFTEIDSEALVGDARSLGQLNWRARLFGQTSHESIEILRGQILDRYGYQTECNTSLLWIVPEWNCLAGLQQLVRALENLGGSSPNPEYLGVEKIEISTHWGSRGGRWDALELQIPYSANAGAIGLWLVYQIQKNSRPADRKFVSTLNDRIKSEANQLNFEIRIADELNPKQIERGLVLLNQAVEGLRKTNAQARTNPGEKKMERVEPLFDYVVLARDNEWRGEHSEKLGIHFNVNQNLNRAVWTLKYEYANCDADAARGRPTDVERLKNCEDSYRTKSTLKFREARAELQQIRKDLPSFVIHCGEKGKLPIEHCVQGARAFQKISQLVKREILSTIRHVTITERELYKYLLSPLSLSGATGQGRLLEMSYNSDPKQIAGAIYQAFGEKSN